MKKTIALLLIAVALMATGCSGSAEKLYVYNWGNYIDDTLLTKFSEQTGIEVVYEEYATNEDMYVKIKNGGSQYDLIFPSDYMLEKMIKEDMLEKIDVSAIENYKNVGDDFKNLAYDPKDAYSVPYLWGTVGILYNKTMVDEPVDSWEILFKEKYKQKILMLDSQRDTLMIALKLLGYSMNTRDEAELEAAKELLIKQKDLVLSYVVDNGKDIMLQGGAAFMPAWNGDAVELIRTNPDLDFALPKEGTNLWYDVMAIPKGAPNKAAAMQFIDFMLDAENAAENARSIGYATPNTEAFKLLDGALQNDKIAYPDKASLKNSEVFADPGEFLEVYNKIWSDLKMK